MRGRIEVSPTEYHGKTACKYCPYISICCFDTTAGCRYRRRVRLTPINSSEEKINERIKMPNFNYKIIIVIYMVIMSIIGFASMGIDKNGQSIKMAHP